MNKAGVDNVSRMICGCPNGPSGGIPFVGLGDFRQADPIVIGAGQRATQAAQLILQHCGRR